MLLSGKPFAPRWAIRVGQREPAFASLSGVVASDARRVSVQPTRRRARRGSRQRPPGSAARVGVTGLRLLPPPPFHSRQVAFGGAIGRGLCLARWPCAGGL